MSKISYPISTAAIYNDTIYPITLNSKHDIAQELKLATEWFKRWHSSSEKSIRGSMLVSFWGLYLTFEQSMERAA